MDQKILASCKARVGALLMEVNKAAKQGVTPSELEHIHMLTKIVSGYKKPIEELLDDENTTQDQLCTIQAMLRAIDIAEKYCSENASRRESA